MSRTGVKFKKYPVKINGKDFYMVGETQSEYSVYETFTRYYTEINIYTKWHKWVYRTLVRTIYDDDGALDFVAMIRKAAQEYSRFSLNEKRLEESDNILQKWSGEINEQIN